MSDNKIQKAPEIDRAPLISVVLPVYNGRQYLADAIDSILSQTMPDFELIMIDDGSTDESLGIMRKYAESDARVRIVSRENRGLATTLNDSIDIARGVWLARMDQDDIALPHRFERQLSWLTETGADISGSWIKRFGASDTRVVKLRQTDSAIKMEMLFCSPFAHPTVMMRTDLARQLRYDRSWEKAEDYDMWERAAEAGWKMTNVQEVLLMYRMHESQISTVTASRQHELTQQIRRRYWKFCFEKWQLNPVWIEPVLEVREPSSSKVDMDIIDTALGELIGRSNGEERDTIWDHATRLYFWIAADCPDIVSRWKRLNSNLAGTSAFSTTARLWMVRSLRLRPNSGLFNLLKRLYFSLAWNR